MIIRSRTVSQQGVEFLYFDNLPGLYHSKFRRHGLHGDLDQFRHGDGITDGKAGFDA